jgi:hypothetical protein
MTHVSFGDTVPAARFWHSLETALWAVKLAGRPVVFTIDRGAPMSRPEAEAWVAESEALGFTEIRFDAAPTQDGTIVVDLAAIQDATG